MPSSNQEMSRAAFATYAGDKAGAGSRRVPERVLHVLSLAGGWPGALVAQEWYRHKTRKVRFQIIFWLIVAAHVAAVAALLYIRPGSSNPIHSSAHRYEPVQKPLGGCAAEATATELIAAACPHVDSMRSRQFLVRQMTARRPAGPQNVLFIGNSFTARNDLPGLIATLAAARGKEFRYRLISAGGASLRRHWNAGEAVNAIRSGKYDVVVLQEQSTLPVKNATRMHENVRLFDGAIKAAGARAYLYMTWARRNVPESQASITEAYAAIAKEIGTTLVPVGVAWQTLLHRHAIPVLHDRDGSHPTTAGSYLAACVFFAVMFRESPVGIVADPAGLGTTERTLLQRIAWQQSRTAIRSAGRE